MAKLIVKENGFFDCEGKGKCSGTDFNGRKQVIRCFNCRYCKSYKKEGLKIKNKKEQTKLFEDEW